ncbi:MAG: excinuclease ABC subunit UvrA [Oscillospiraceae bacterium]|nr:excinuclease ABC subunit UvrA [Oscillospiraceae bacterium]
MALENIVIKGAREHNLKNIDISIPRDKFIVMTGISGSGKSSLAFDTIYADGQRRYIESLSSYARQFLGQMEKPDVDSIEGLSPAISIDQKTTSRNPRSTVGTVTEIYDYLRLLYARIGTPHCPICGREIKNQTVDQIVDSVLELDTGTRFQVLAPVVKGRKGEHKNEFEAALRAGYVRARVDGTTYYLSEPIPLNKNQKHDIEIIVDRLVIEEGITSRLTDSIETALGVSGSSIVINLIDDESDLVFSQSYACPEHGSVGLDELTPRMFSFNNPFGACEVCTGLGTYLKVDEHLIVPNINLSITEGAIRASGWNYVEGSIARMYFDALAKQYGFSVDQPLSELTEEAYKALLWGTGDIKMELYRENEYGYGSYLNSFEGVINNLERRHKETQSDWTRAEIEGLMSEEICPACGGKRLKASSLAVTVGDSDIMSLCFMSISELLKFFNDLELNNRQQLIADRVVNEIKERLGFLSNVGLNYLSLSRAAGSLSGGENQRIRLATQIGSSLMGVLYVLDEPSIGLHQRDNVKLISALKRLRDLGNTLIVVEHDEETIRSADYIVDIGPGAGVHGGEIVVAGEIDEIIACKHSVTGQYLSGTKAIKLPKTRREGNGHSLLVKGARQNNLKDIDVEFPLGKLICVTGVSGSGKSSLVNDILFKKLHGQLNRARVRAGDFDVIEGMENLDKVIAIDQSPIGRTPRSNPATYTGVFTFIRDVFASTNEAKMRGYNQGRFSFNVRGGRCEACQGDGIIRIEMHFLPDVYVPCEVCHGDRYNRETLEVHYNGRTVANVLAMPIEQAAEFFKAIPVIARHLNTLVNVGLGYVRLGQPAPTLSGGEAQRVKLASELQRRSSGRTVYVLDEPTTGLHFDDIRKLLGVLQGLVDKGNTVIVIEHNLDVIKSADWVIDLGPEGGSEGGLVVAEGTPEQVALNPDSYTGQYLAKVLAG